ncbi:HIT family protein [bacterium]|nr:HIT family protein [bacterium]
MSNYKFMDAFHPTKTLIKEFQHWVVLLREGQVTLGDCLIVLKRETPFLGDMTDLESQELSSVLKWYEKKCKTIFGAVKFNYIVAMMRDNFVHFHAFPRYSDTVNRYGIEWKDEKWPRVIQFGASQCDSSIYDMIINDLSD